MHTPEIRQKFVERRAQGWSLTRISSELGVAKSTLVEWTRKLRFEIQNQTAIEMDDLKNRLLGHRQGRASMISAKLAAVEEEIRKRNLSTVPTQSLYSISAALQRQLEQVIGDTTFAMPSKDIPNDEYVEEVQQWKA